jgi:hypothetical protein
MTNWEKNKQFLSNSEIAFFDDVPDYVLNYLRNNIIRKNEYSANKNLAGHIKEEYNYENRPREIDNFFINKGLENKTLNYYINQISILTKNVPFVIDKLWCNFMKKHEFNPLHKHSGVLSFIVFLKIPYDLEDEDKVYIDVEEDTRKTSRLEFVNYNNTFGLTPRVLDVDKSFENKLLIFPANYHHQVYPFYTSNEERITVSGNVKFFIN